MSRRACCFQFFSPARPPAEIDGPVIVPDPKGKSFYFTSINRLAALNIACERENAK